MRKKIFIILGVLLILWGIKRFFIRPAKPEVTLKLKLIKDELKGMGYHPKWFMISGYRDQFLTKISYNNAKKGSFHESGMAIDIEVIDIDGDWTYDDKDLELFKEANKRVELKNPQLRGALGTYISPCSDWLERHQIHIDTRGKSKFYNEQIKCN